MPIARLATRADLAAVQAITARAYESFIPLMGGKPLPMTEDYLVRIAAGEVWLIADHAADVAVAVLEHAPDHLLIFSLAVIPGQQGRGLGQWLLAFAEHQARTHGRPELRLYTNPLMERNIRIYTEAGYRETGRRPNPYRPGWVLVDMMKTL